MHALGVPNREAPRLGLGSTPLLLLLNAPMALHLIQLNFPSTSFWGFKVKDNTYLETKTKGGQQ